jgi:hypothetical protein
MKAFLASVKSALVAGIFVLAFNLHAAETVAAKNVAAKKSNATAASATVANKSNSTKGAAAATEKRARRAGYGSSGSTDGALAEAYGLMKRADHDYKGHRARAMHQVEAAARLLGEGLGGDGRGHEAQGTSDDQLREAQSVLKGACGKIAGLALKHVEEAIGQLSTALSVR